MSQANLHQQPADGRSDFDFEVGRWRVLHRRLPHALQGSTAWEEFEGISLARKILGGWGMIDEITNQRGAQLLYGMTVRVLDPQSHQWTMYTANSVYGLSAIPMIGDFTNGIGRFHAFEPVEGRHIFTRFLWLDITPTSYRWEQAFSADGGSTWETNWTQDHLRLPE